MSDPKAIEFAWDLLSLSECDGELYDDCQSALPRKAALYLQSIGLIEKVGDGVWKMADAAKVPPPATKRVRAAVAISETGQYDVVGWHTQKQQAVDSAAREEVLESFYGNAREGTPHVYFIEADVPLPVAQTIQAVVVQEGK